MKKHIEKSDVQSGFTLIEVLVAMMVLSIAIVMILQLFSTNLKSLPKSELYSKAVFAAKAKMEEILLSDSIVVGESSGDIDDTFSWNMNISEYNPNPDETEKEQSKKDSPSLPIILKIDLSVIWNNKNKEKSYTLSTLISAIE